jgi:DegV family protein with EDD domain
MASDLSACNNSALQAKSMLKDKNRIFIFDSKNVAAGQALLLLRAVELIQEQKEIEEIVKELEKLSLKIHLYAIIKDPKWIEAGGRVSTLQADWIRKIQKTNLYPIMILKNGLMQKGGTVLAQDMAEAIFKKIKKESQGKKIRVIISQADNLEEAKKLKEKLKGIKAEVCYINLVSPAICAHTGPGTLIAAWTPLNN